MVDVTEIETPKYIPENIMEDIFYEQLRLANKYAEIEDMGNLLKNISTNLDTQNGQVWLKDFIYRAIEEVGESYEVIRNMKSEFKSLPENLKIHYSEEIIDALHFFIELCIIAGYNSNDFKGVSEYGHQESKHWFKKADFQRRHWAFVESMTLAGNCLRNKKWKKTDMLTDRNKFKKYLDEALFRLLTIVRTVGLSDEDIYVLYFKKNAVNQFRQRSNY